MNRSLRRPPIALLVALGVLMLAALALLAPRAQAEETAADAALQKVETHKVCMVNDQLFAKDQIPVEVEGKTYYGCCEMCKERLARDSSMRQAVDPVSGEPVDKATAVIGALADGRVLYFASEETFAQYRPEPAEAE
ncbi:MAG TPA: hypothetical protein VMT16_12190 [Thermoanaerobaculia bacterium]|nr:hypothetical protein [Thermoanaerobaculia bacterium]